MQGRFDFTEWLKSAKTPHSRSDLTFGENGSRRSFLEIRNQAFEQRHRRRMSETAPSSKVSSRVYPLVFRRSERQEVCSDGSRKDSRSKIPLKQKPDCGLTW